MAWDDWLTKAGDALIAPQMGPFGQMMPVDPAARDPMIGNALLTLGASLSQGARARQGPIESLGHGMQNLGAQGAQRGQQQMQAALIGGKLQEQQRKNQTMEALAKMPPPPGMDPQAWGAFVQSDPGAAFKLMFEGQQAARRAAAYGGGDVTASSGDFRTGDPVLDWIAGRESGGRNVPNAGGSGATGPLQIMPATWSGLVKKYGQSHGLTEAGINDPKQQAIAGPLLKGEITQAFGGTATPAQTYLGWFLGSGAAPKIARMDPSTPIEQAIAATHSPEHARQVFAQNQQVFSKIRTVGDLMSWAGAGAPGQGGPQQAQSPVQPVQYTAPNVAQPAGSSGGQQPQQGPDPGIAALRQAQRKALAADDDALAGKIEMEIAKRQGTLADRPHELARAQAQGRERAEIARETEVLKRDVEDASKFSSEIQAGAL